MLALILRSKIAVSNDKCICNFARYYQVPLPVSCIILFSYQQRSTHFPIGLIKGFCQTFECLPQRWEIRSQFSFNWHFSYYLNREVECLFLWWKAICFFFVVVVISSTGRLFQGHMGDLERLHNQDSRDLEHCWSPRRTQQQHGEPVSSSEPR